MGMHLTALATALCAFLVTASPNIRSRSSTKHSAEHLIRRDNVTIPADVVTTHGTYFSLNGKPWTFAGTNIVALANRTSEDEIRNEVQQAQEQGYIAFRTWFFAEWNSDRDPQPYIHVQKWQNGTPSINEGPDGIQKLDQIVKAAEDFGQKIVVVLTNNWLDGWGGMDTYVNATQNVTKHSLFFTEDAPRKYFKDYVRTIVQRYQHSSAILAWELANEARCGSNAPDGMTNIPPYQCLASTITAWTDEMSSYIKSIDPIHMVAFGGEGFFARQGQTTYEYNGGSGQDFDAIMKLPGIDFGTVHCYPNGNLTWAAQFLIDHLAPAQEAQKPLVLEEYGYNIHTPNISRADVFGLWHGWEMGKTIWYQGDMPWLFATKESKPDGYSLNPADPDFAFLVTNFTKRFNGKAATLSW